MKQWVSVKDFNKRAWWHMMDLGSIQGAEI